MPRKAKEEIIEVNDELVKKEVNSKSKASKKVSTKKAVTKTESKKVVEKKTPSKNLAKKENSNKKSKTDSEKKTTSTKKSTTKSTTKTKKTTSKTTKATTTKKQTKKKVEVVEYYDLPYRYNQTVVKVLAQTPTTLFVYWDISDSDRENYINTYGEYFFHNTKPVLIIHNKTKNYTYEVDIDDFANSWYLRLIDSDCDYQIELGRRPINEYAKIENDYLHITNSNTIESPNDHILFDKLSHFVYFKNVKTNKTIKKDTNLTLLNKITKISSIKEFYQKLYPTETINYNKLNLKNPSSSN